MKRPRGPATRPDVLILGAGHRIGAEALPVGRGGVPEQTTTTGAPRQNQATSCGSQTLVLEDFPDPMIARTLSPNGRAHWATKKRARDTVECIVGQAILAQRLDDSLMGWPVRITYRWVMPDRRRRDLDNHSTGVVKVVQDCLVRHGLISADDTSCVVAISTEVVYEKGRRALEIVLEEV